MSGDDSQTTTQQQIKNSEKLMDERAKQILLTAYWGSRGWKSGEVPDEDFAYAQSRGVMFPKRTFKHASLIRDTINIRDSVGWEKVAQAFVCSLSTRQLWLRSTLGSYGNCEELVAHRFRAHPSTSMGYLCSICSSTRESRNVNLNILNFERIKWGGVRHGEDLVYNWFDLQQLSQINVEAPTNQDKKILKAIFREMKQAVSAKEGSGKLKKRFKPLLPSNNDELDTLVNILAEAKLITINGFRIAGCDEDLFEEYFEDYL
jgi:hypothetical protein